LLAAAVVFSAFVAAAGNPACVAAGAAVAAGAGWLASKGGNAAFVVAILVPTVCHVFVFTWAFMLAGALRSGSRTAWAGVAAMLAAAATFLLPGGHYPAPTLAGLENFQPAADVLKSALPQELGTRVFGFLGFAYAYHYLNWFSKAEAIKWNRMPRERLMWIVGVYAFIECAYFRDFRLGFLVAMFPSVLHVLLEFPLNTATFASIGRAALNGGKRAA
jgi:hypothetical protein